MALSIFEDPDHQPDEQDLEKALSERIAVWNKLHEHLEETYPQIAETWSFTKNWGWNARIKSKKRTVLYLTPREEHFIVGFVYGGKATDAALNSGLPENIKEIIRSAKVYAEGRGFRVEVLDAKMFEILVLLVQIKMAH